MTDITKHWQVTQQFQPSHKAAHSEVQVHSQQQQPASAHQLQAQQAISDLDHQLEVLHLNQQAQALALQSQVAHQRPISEQIRMYQEETWHNNQTKQNY